MPKSKSVKLNKTNINSNKKLTKVLILGSGALKIGEAGEFDYSGSQAIKALKEEGIETVLINPNIATIQTSELFADKVYFLPVNPYFVERVIEKEKPQAILLSFGGQTALNCGVELFQKGVFKKHNCEVLGTPVESIILSEDRDLFATHLRKMNISTPRSVAVKNLDDAKKVAKSMGLPLMIRAAYALGGLNSGVVYKMTDFEKLASQALAVSPQILVEQYLHHFKEIEYEIVRDKYDNCISVCNMENFDPIGIHTGESIVVAPSQTLTNEEYHVLRSKAIEIARSLNIVGECNVQFALSPNKSLDYYVIELNARLSRSSALASKATGYPLAYVAAKLALGKSLIDIPNQVTKVTKSFFEPALDYVVVKVPRWDLEKFSGAHEDIGTSMKSVGEVMGIGRNFEEAIQKAVRMLEIGAQGVLQNGFKNHKEILAYLKKPTYRRLFAITNAIKNKVDLQYIHKTTGIDMWFLYRLKEIVNVIDPKSKLTKEKLSAYKKLGYSDKQIAEIHKSSETTVRDLRKKYSVLPSFFQIDTLAGEVPAQTNYLYATYAGGHNDVSPLGKKSVMVLGSGPYRIGSSVEFDWACVNTALALQKKSRQSIIVNCNPETVSTDYDMSDRLYFEELTLERVLDIYEFEKSEGVITSVGGQTPNNLSPLLTSQGVNILGTPAETVQRVENRKTFSALLDKLGIPQAKWDSLRSVDAALAFAKKVGYPVLLRPSYVLSGSAMTVCYTDKQLRAYIKKYAHIGKDYPITVTQFISSAKEIEYDGVAEQGHILTHSISEHIELAGVHSGDAHIIFPAQRIFSQTERKIKIIAEELVKELVITGPFNIQFIAKDNDVFVIEMNVRASRTVPFISKVTGVNYPALAVDACFGVGEKVDQIDIPYVAVKAPQFSFARLPGADPVLRVEMSSTGEVACFGETASEAYLKALYATGFQVRKKGVLFTVGGDAQKEKMLDAAWKLASLGFTIYTTENTHKFLKDHHVPSVKVAKVYEGLHPNVVDVIRQGEISIVINISESFDRETENIERKVSDGYRIRRAAVEKNALLLTDVILARFFVKALTKYKMSDLKIEAWDEYLNKLK
ncbi:MAG: carbamoyl-phosphate synthase (glutamine-hydrolyzing) large subunit [Patescibacteria group bacterium]